MGYGVPADSDYVEAYKWYSLAASSGDRDARRVLNSFEPRGKDLLEAQRRAAEFVPKPEDAL